MPRVRVVQRRAEFGLEGPHAVAGERREFLDQPGTIVLEVRALRMARHQRLLPGRQRGIDVLQRGDTIHPHTAIERAAQAEPDSVEIAEHLGDVYWASGRRFEARYAWTAARQTAEPAVAERLTTKIADGL